jgi:hypothetical protein
MADIIGSRAHHGAVYNLVDPAPPTNRELVDLMEAHYGVEAGRFVEPRRARGGDGEDSERKLNSSMRKLHSYVLDPPAFDRTNVAGIEASFGRRWPRWDAASIGRVMDFAQRAGWRERWPMSDVPVPDDPYEVYFNVFLPEQFERVGCSEMVDLNTTLRFIVDGAPGGEWGLCFERGRLVRVRRGASGVREDFAYRMGVETFWDIASARVDPQEAFIAGRVEVSGDVEQALKMGMIFRQLNSEHPYTRGPGAPCEESAHV